MNATNSSSAASGSRSLLEEQLEKLIEDECKRIMTYHFSKLKKNKAVKRSQEERPNIAEEIKKRTKE